MDRGGGLLPAGPRGGARDRLPFLDVAKALCGIGRADTERDEPPGRFEDEGLGLPDRGAERRRGGDAVVGGHHRHDRIGIVTGNQERGQADAGGGVTFARFPDEPRFRDGRELLADGREEAGRGDDHQPVRGNERIEPGDGVLEERRRSGQGKELLREGSAAGGPKSGAGSSGHDDRVEHRGFLSGGGAERALQSSQECRRKRGLRATGVSRGPSDTASDDRRPLDP